MNAELCHHCQLPLRGWGQTREVKGESHQFCCYGCCLAYQVRHGEREEPEAVWLLIRLGVGAFLAMNIMLFSLLLYSGSFGPTDQELQRIVHFLLWILATPLLFILGGPFIGGAWNAARRGRANADTLVSLGAVSAYGYSAQQTMAGGDAVYFDTVAMVLLLFTLGRYLEAIGRVQAMRSLAPMLAAERARATVVRDGRDIELPVRAVVPGTVVRARPGERIPVDGVVIEGRSQCNEAVLTGQSEACVKHPGAAVYAGSVNGTGQLLIRATLAGMDTRWGQISRQVREALSHKGMVGEIVDRAAAAFVPLVAILAAATTLYWGGRGPLEEALMAGLAVLVVACPCALGLAAPLATAIGLGLGAQRGVLIRGGGALERLARLKAVAFDKTGTLTTGDMQLVDIVNADIEETALLRRAAGLAQGSEHPIARGILAATQARGLVPSTASDLRACPGEGVAGDVVGVYTAMGSAAFMAAQGWMLSRDLTDQGAARAEGLSLVYLGWDGQVRGSLSLADTLLADAPGTVASLGRLGLATCLLSGDTRPAAARTAEAVGIANWRGELSPAGKVDALKAWSRRHGPVAMVGDGLNDGPVLAAAAVGIAVGGATDLARETADATLPEGALATLPWMLQLARRIRRTIATNIVWALGYNVVALSLAAAGLLQPIIAAALMAGSSLLVVINSLHAGRKAGDQTDEAAQGRVGAAAGLRP
jgi:Cu2+-exporting ATPase